MLSYFEDILNPCIPLLQGPRSNNRGNCIATRIQSLTWKFENPAFARDSPRAGPRSAEIPHSGFYSTSSITRKEQQHGLCSRFCIILILLPCYGRTMNLLQVRRHILGRPIPSPPKFLHQLPVRKRIKLKVALICQDSPGDCVILGSHIAHYYRYWTMVPGAKRVP